MICTLSVEDEILRLKLLVWVLEQLRNDFCQLRTNKFLFVFLHLVNRGQRFALSLLAFVRPHLVRQWILTFWYSLANTQLAMIIEAASPVLPTFLGPLVCCRWPESRLRGSRRIACPRSASLRRWASPWGTCSAPPASSCPGPRGRESRTRNQSKAWKGRPDSLGEETVKDANEYCFRI